MQLFRIARHPTRALRTALAVLLLAFGLNAFAHAGHMHGDAGAANLHAATCGYCATFDSLAATPATLKVRVVTPLFSFLAIAFLSATVIRRVSPTALPRAPPRS